MSSLNKTLLIGNLGRDPEVRYMPDGTAVANISLATTSSYKDKAAVKQDVTEWHRVSFFGRLAEIAGEYLKKGSQIYVEGSLQTRKWTDKDGVEKYTTEIRANELKMLGGRSGNSSGSDAPQANEDAGAPTDKSDATKAPAGKPVASSIDDDGIPY